MQAENILLFSLLTESPQPLIYSGANIRREDYAHLNVTRSVASIAYLPLQNEGLLLGAFEIISFSAVLERGQLEDMLQSSGWLLRRFWRRMTRSSASRLCSIPFIG